MAFYSIIDYTFFAFTERFRCFITYINPLKIIFCFSRRSYILVLFSVIFNSHFYAQVPTFTWAVGAGTNADQHCESITTDASGNVYTCGNIRNALNNFSGNFISSLGGEDIYISKYDGNGNFIWVVRAGGAFDDHARSITTDASGNIYVTGYYTSTATFFGSSNIILNSTGAEDIFVAKYNPSGNIVWAVSAGGAAGNDQGASICTDGNNVYVTGFFNGTANFPTLLTSSGGTDVFITSFNAITGAPNGAFRGGTTFNDYGNGIAVDPSGLYITGIYGDGNASFQNHPGTLGNIGFDDVFCVKYDFSGNGLWKFRMGNNPGNDAATSICVNGNNLYLAGYYSGTMSLYESGGGPVVTTTACAGTQDAFVAQYNATSGLFGWVRSVSGTAADQAYGVSTNPIGDVFLTGGFNGTIPLTPGPNITSVLDDPFLIKYNSSGSLQWGKQISGTNNDIASCVISPNNIDILVGGWFKSAPTSFDAINLNTFGNDDVFFAKIGCSVTGANAGPDLTVCSSTLNLAGNTPAAGTGSWTVISGTATITSPASPTTGITALGVGSNTFRWTITNGTCISFDDVIIKRDGVPTTPNAGANQRLCASTPSTTMNGNSPTVGTGTWSVLSGTANIITPSSPTTAVTGIATGTAILQWAIGNGTCTTLTSTMSIIVDASPTTPTAGANQRLCASTNSTTLTGNIPAVGSGTWTVLSGTASITTPSLSNSTATGIATGTNILQWAISNGTCATQTSTMSIIVDAVPTTPVAGSNKRLCASTPTTTMAGNVPSVGTGTWSVLSGTATITTPSLATTSVTGIATGTNILQWAIGNGTCTTLTSTMSIIVDASPTTPTAGANQRLCASTNSTTLTGNIPAIGSGTWTVISGTASITTPSLSNSTATGIATGTNILQWAISNGTCATQTSTMSIIVDAVPTTPVAGSNKRLCASTPTTTMAGNVPSVGTGTWSVLSGTATITTPSLATTAVTAIATGTNILQWAIGNGTCTTLTSTMSIIVDASPTTPTAGANQRLCASANSTTLTGNIPAIGSGTWTVISGTASITTPSLSNSTATGIATGTNILQWAISNGTCATQTSTMSIIVDAVPTTPVAGSNKRLCASTPTTTMAGNVPSVGTGTWSVLSGTATITTPSLATTSVTGIATGTNILQWAIGNGTCTTLTSTMSIIVDASPTTPTAGANQRLCASTNSTTLTGNTPAIGSGTWTVISGTASITTPSLSNSTATGIATGTNILQWAIGNGTCTTLTSTMSIIVDAAPTTPTAGANQRLCASTNSTTLTGNIPAIGSGTWTVISGTASITTPSLSNSTATGIATGTNILQWAISNGTCATQTSTMSIIVDAVPTTPVAGPNKRLCASTPTTTMAGNVPSVGTGTWSVLSGTATITTPSLATTAVTAIATGTTILQWAIGNGTCTTLTSTMSIIVDAAPTAPTAGANQRLCASTNSTTLTGNIPAIGSGTWTVISGTASITTPSLGNSTATGIATGTNILQWAISNGTCASQTSTMSIIVDAVPNTAIAGSNYTLCASTPTFTMAGNTPTVGNGMWTLLSGTATITTPTLETSGVTGLAVGTNIFQWAISNGTCSASTSTMSIQIDDVPTTATAGSNYTLCASSPAFTMAGNTPTVGSGMWTLLSGTATITTPTLETTGVTGLALGTNIFQWAISNGTCSSSTSTMSIQIDDVPTTATAGSNYTLCASSPSFTMAGNTPTVGSGMWTLLSGTATITTPTLETTGVTGLALGTNIFQWAISNGTCSASTSTMSIQMDDVPTTATAGSNYTLCASSPSFTMAGNTPTVGSGMWTLLSGTATITTPTLETTGVTGLALGTNIFQWAISNGTCSSSTSTMSIQIDDVPTTATAGSNYTLCASTPTFTMAGNTPTVGSGMWTLLSGTATITTPTLETTGVTGLALGTNIFQWAISNGTCSASTSTMSIQMDDVPTTATAGSNFTLCASSPSFTMAGNTATVGSGMWTLLSGTASITTPTLETTDVTGLAVGTNIFQWAISNGTCSASTSTMSIQIDDIPTAATAGTNQALCTNSVILAGNIPTNGIGVWTVNTGTSSITSPTLNNTAVTNLNIGLNSFIWSISNGTCSVSSDTVDINVSNYPDISVTASDYLICDPASFNISANLPVVGTGSWTVIQGTGVLSSTTNTVSIVTGFGYGDNIFRWSISESPCPDTFDDIKVTVFQMPSPAVAGNDQLVYTDKASLNATSPLVGNGNWVNLNPNNWFTAQNNGTTEVNNLDIGANILIWQITNGVCPMNSDTIIVERDNVTITGAFSPNGDNVNDFFIIKGIETFEKVSLTVFNRWGDLVYENDNYSNNWQGESKNGKKLSDDTYYYLLKLNNSKEIKGYVLIKQR